MLPMCKIPLLPIFFIILVAACATKPEPLPHSLYFRDGDGADAQVWRLEQDGITKQQITKEAAGVDAFSVSPADGTLAFISNNQLFLMDAGGGNRRLIADGSTVDPGSEDYVFHGLVSDPSFSPDGRTLAYAFDGLHLYDVGTGEDRHILTNFGNLLGETFVFSQEAYFPGAWSPDGSQLLIIMSYYEGSTLAVMELDAEQPFTRLRSDGTVCCQFKWANDSRTVLVSNPYYTMELPGMWRYDAKTGAQTVVVPGIAEDGSLNFAGWPQELPSGELLFFSANLERFSPEVGIPLKMVKSDGVDIEQIREEEFQIAEALWSWDGTLAIVLGRWGESGRQMLLVRTDTSPLQVLVEECGQIHDLAWGP